MSHFVEVFENERDGKRWFYEEQDPHRTDVKTWNHVLMVYEKRDMRGEQTESVEGKEEIFYESSMSSGGVRLDLKTEDRTVSCLV